MSELKQIDELLWRLYCEHREQNRFHGGQRALITHCILLIAAAVLALVELGDVKPLDQRWLGIFLALIGGIGAYLTRGHSTACGMEQDCSYSYLSQLQQRFKGKEVKFELNKSDEEKKLGRVWIGVNLIVLVLGILLLSMII